MRANKIAKAIKSECEEDKNMKNFLMDLLEFTMTGKQWYKEEYKKQIKKYVDMEENNEN